MAATRWAKAVRAQFKGFLGYNNTQFDLSFQCDEEPTLLDLVEYGGILKTWWEDNIAPITSSAYALVEIVLTGQLDLDSPRYVEKTGLPTGGLNASPIMPENVTLAIKLATGKRGRGRSGRVFVVGLCEGDVVNDTVSTAYVNDAIAAFEAVNTPMGAAANPARLAVLHSYAAGVHLGVGTVDVVESIGVTDQTVDSQRDRLPGHKKHKKPSP